MEVLNIKIEKSIVKDIDKAIHNHRYSTKSEFVRDAIREKLSSLEKEAMLKHIEKIAGSSKRKTTDEDLHRVREMLAKADEKRFR